MEKPEHRIEAVSLDWPSGLKTIEDAAQDLGIGAERLGELADGGFAPHFRIDGGPPQFRISELRRWAAINLVQQFDGRDFPAPIRIVLSAAKVTDFRKVPASLREVVGLCDITDETRRIGVYFLVRDGCLLYVGQSVNAVGRVAEHYRRYEFDSVLFLPWPADDLNRIEAALIRALRPPLNSKSVNGAIRTPSRDQGDNEAALIAALTNPPADHQTPDDDEPLATNGGATTAQALTVASQ
jgi:hypothetical protein